MTWIGERDEPGVSGMAHAPPAGGARERRADALVGAHQEVSALLAEGGPPVDTLSRVLQVVCTSLDWGVGAVWRLNGARTELRCAAVWSSGEGYAAFVGATRQTELAKGIGLPGRVWASGRPAWLVDVTEDRTFPRAEAARRSGVRGGVCVPLRDGETFLGALELSSARQRELDREALDLCLAIGAQLAQHLALRESRLRFEAVVASVADAIVMADGSGRIVGWNVGAERIFGYRRDEALGQALTLLMPERYVAAHRAGFERLTRTGEATLLGSAMELSGRRKSGEEFPLELTLTGLDDREEPLYSGIVRDLTERKRLEALSAREMTQRALAAEQAALRRVATAVASGSEPSVIFDLAAREVSGLLGADCGAVVSFRPDGEAAALVGRWGGVVAPSERPAGARGRTPIALVERTGRAASVADLADLSDDTEAAAMARAGFRGAAAAPVRVGPRLWGALAMAVRGPLPPAAEERLEQLAYLVALTVGNAETRALLIRQAASDPLTGLANHRAFHERLHGEVERASRHGRDLALALIDLDHFKEVNDTHGHQAGDRVLAEAGRRLAALAREGELVARVGGGGFAWILPETDGIAAFQVAERGRRIISAAPFPGVGRLGASAGVCDLAQAGGTGEMLVQLADGALYWAKTHGRDRTYRYTPEVVESLSAAERAERLERNQALTGLRALARAVDAKDSSTQAHSERVADLAVRLARLAGLSSERSSLLHEAALIHDVGKIGIPDAILFKPGRLTVAEYERVKQHADLGAEIAAEVVGAEQAMWIRAHHERWDGKGYPRGLAGEAIPPEACLLALADAWDVMTSFRLYQRPISVAQALEECRRERSLQFCPAAVGALERLHEAQQAMPAAPAAPAAPAPG